MSFFRTRSDEDKALNKSKLSDLIALIAHIEELLEKSKNDPDLERMRSILAVAKHHAEIEKKNHLEKILHL